MNKPYSIERTRSTYLPEAAHDSKGGKQTASAMKETARTRRRQEVALHLENQRQHQQENAARFRKQREQEAWHDRLAFEANYDARKKAEQEKAEKNLRERIHMVSGEIDTLNPEETSQTIHLNDAEIAAMRHGAADEEAKELRERLLLAEQDLKDFVVYFDDIYNIQPERLNEDFTADDIQFIVHPIVADKMNCLELTTAERLPVVGSIISKRKKHDLLEAEAGKLKNKLGEYHSLLEEIAELRAEAAKAEIKLP